MENQDYYQNHFLVAMPSLNDINYSKAVVFIEEHNENGAIGLIINKPLQLNIGNMMDHLDITISNLDVINQTVFMGGPVGQDQGFVLHKPWTEEEKSSSDNDIVNSASKEILRQIASGEGPNDFIIALGYSGWEPGQIEKEVQNNDWLTVPCDPDILFNTPTERRWETAIKLLGFNLNNLSGLSGHA